MMTEQNEAIELYRSLVMMSDGEGYTTSCKIADRFNRSHHNVLKSIDRLNAAINKSRKFDLTREIFKDASYIDARGKVQREFIITKDGFLMLAMRFEGAAALEWQLLFIAAFNWLIQQMQVCVENNRLMAAFDIKNRQSVELGSFHGQGLAAR